MQLAELTDLFRHMQWADASVWRAIMSSEGARSDAKLRELFYHLHLVQRAFLRAWRGEPRDTPFPTFDDSYSVMNWGRAYYGKVFAHLERVSNEELAQPMHLPWTEIVEKELGRTPASLSIGETMLQVPLHSLYHRGQINSRLREVGGEPPRVDYIVWMWLAKPAPDWEWASVISESPA